MVKVKQPKGSSAKEKERKLSDAELIHLAEEIKGQECIWDLSNENHKVVDAIAAAWELIATATNLTVAECKRGWKSLRDMLRYRMSGKSKGQGHSGDSGGEESQMDVGWSEDDNERLLESWKFGDCMGFVLRKPYSRNTLSSETLVLDMPQDNYLSLDSNTESSASGIDNSPAPSPASSRIISKTLPAKKPASTTVVSNYDYANRGGRGKGDKVGEKLVNTVAKLVNLRKEQKVTSQFKHHAMLANLDEMLSKLPNYMVEDLSFEFLRLTHEKLKEYRNLEFYVVPDNV